MSESADSNPNFKTNGQLEDSANVNDMEFVYEVIPPRVNRNQSVAEPPAKRTIHDNELDEAFEEETENQIKEELLKLVPDKPEVAQEDFYSEELQKSISKDLLSNFSSEPVRRPSTMGIKGRGRNRGHKSASQYSMMSSASGMNGNREISETFVTKLRELTFPIIATLINAGLLYFFILMGTTGVQMAISIDIVTKVCAVLFEVVLLVTNIITLIAMDNASAAYFGFLLCQKKGYSLSACGFQQTSPFLKWRFCSELSLNSPNRKFFSRLAIFWLYAEILKIMTPIPATSMTGSTFTQDSGTVSCIIYGTDGDPFNRQWPTVNVEAGVAELVFGTAIGYLRSERSDISITTAIMTPQIVGAVQDGDTIIGSGFTTDIFTSCLCTAGNSVSDIADVISDGSTASASGLLSNYTSLNGYVGVASYIDTESLKSKNMTVINSLLSGPSLCGGVEISYLTFCTTTFSNHRQANVLVEYMTDGTPASIAVKSTHVRDYYDVVDFSWVNAALVNIHEGKFSSVRLPSNIPGAVNPLLWWATPNLLTVDPALLEGGIETYFTILLRAGMQRSYSVSGTSCTVNLEVAGASHVVMEFYGMVVCILILSSQLVLSIASIYAFVPWFQSEKPIGPGVRLTKDEVYFLALVNSSPILHVFGDLCNAPGFTIWQNLDVICRIGCALDESDAEVGHISLDKPKLIRDLKNGMKYY